MHILYMEHLLMLDGRGNFLVFSDWTDSIRDLLFWHIL
jgi:hypothetical protein